MDVEFHIASGGTDSNNLSQCGMRGFAEERKENIDGLNDPKDVDAELRRYFMVRVKEVSGCQNGV